MTDAKPVPRDPNLPLFTAWTNGNTVYGLMKRVDSSENAQLVVYTLGGRPFFYPANVSEYDNRAGGVIDIPGMGVIQSKNKGTETIFLTTQLDGHDMNLSLASPQARGNLNRALEAGAPAQRP